MQTQFYTVPELAEPDAFEKALSGMEGAAAAIMRTIVDDRTWPLDPESRANFAVFIAVQYLRGPDQRRAMEQTLALTTQLEIGLGGRGSVEAWVQENQGIAITTEQADRVWRDATQPGGPPVRLQARGHIEQINALLPEILPYFTGRPWGLFRFDRRSLLTCDTPVSLMPDPAALNGAAGLLATPGIVFPLTRKVGLILASAEPLIGRTPVEEVRRGRMDFEMEPTTSDAKAINASTLGNTREWIFHHPDDAHLVTVDLPKPRQVEVKADIPDFSQRP